MPNTARLYTVDEVLGFPADGNRYEVVDGELLVTPSPRSRHQMVVGELYYLLKEHLRRHPSNLRVALSPADIRFPGEVLVQPDIFVVPVEELSAQDWSSVKTLVLAVEVLSPSSARGDRVVKRRLFQRQGVPVYWVVDPDARMVEVWRPGDDRPEVVTEVLVWDAAPGVPLMVSLDQVFQEC
ncbi:MAG: Uma2 family endonuclease [Gemmatimonadales bacterium]